MELINFKPIYGRTNQAQVQQVAISNLKPFYLRIDDELYRLQRGVEDFGRHQPMPGADVRENLIDYDSSDLESIPGDASLANEGAEEQPGPDGDQDQAEREPQRELELPQQSFGFDGALSSTPIKEIGPQAVISRQISTEITHSDPKELGDNQQKENSSRVNCDVSYASAKSTVSEIAQRASIPASNAHDASEQVQKSSRLSRIPLSTRTIRPPARYAQE